MEKVGCRRNFIGPFRRGDEVYGSKTWTIENNRDIIPTPLLVGRAKGVGPVTSRKGNNYPMMLDLNGNFL